MRKAAALAAIGVVFSASVLLRPVDVTGDRPLDKAGDRSLDTAQDVSLPSRQAPAVIVVPSLTRGQTGVRPGSDRGQTPVGSGSDPVRIGVGPGSEYEYEATQLAGTSGLLEMRTLAISTHAPGVIPVPLESRSPSRGSLSGAFALAGRQTSGAFRTAARAVRAIF
jgi:hypothetical protein